MKKVTLSFLAILTFFLTACETPGQNVYDYREAGQSVIVEFGTVVDARPIKIKGPNTGVGAVAGAGAGAGIGSQIGSGDGTVAAVAGGILVGAIAGAVAEQALQDKTGIDYTIVLESGKTITVPQYFKKDEPVIQTNDRVMVQTSGSYQRVLPAKHLPEQIKRPKGIKVID